MSCAPEIVAAVRLTPNASSTSRSQNRESAIRNLGFVTGAVNIAEFVAGGALCEPRRADFVAGAALCEPQRADFVAGAALCEPRSADFVAGVAHCEPRSADFVPGVAHCEP